MSDYIRRIVSGNKARFKDKDLDVELDLVYVTDQVVIMGFPASGIEGIYRNKREHAKKFLEHRHGKSFWVYNFCPVKENSYPASVFDGRVSRYPFPDHHAPPLAIMPLVAREMNAWLSGSHDRVAVLHCKAGKGRSGTMACTYLLSLDNTPSPPKLQRSLPAKEWAGRRAEQIMDAIPDEEALDNAETDDRADAPSPQPLLRDSSAINEGLVASPTVLTPKSTLNADSGASANPSLKNNKTSTLKDVLDLHTSRRMKTGKPDEQQKQGVSIPSQRRWLYYWALVLSHEAPAHLWRNPSDPNSPSPKVRLTSISLRLRESSGMKMNLVRAANAVLDRTNMNKAGVITSRSRAHVWVSLARYDDALVERLDEWERHTRAEGENPDMGKRRPGSDHMGDEVFSDMFKEGRWDKEKMVRSFARMGAIDDLSVEKGQLEDGTKIHSYTLRPLTNDGWANMKDEIKDEKASDATSSEALDTPMADAGLPASETNSINDAVSQNNPISVQGVILDASREVRVKLYMGQVFMGWAWFIPTFHMPHPPNANGSGSGKTTFHLARKDMDFPLGIGSLIIDVDIALEWVPENGPSPPEQKDDEPAGVAATVQALTAGDAGEMLHAKQAAEE